MPHLAVVYVLFPNTVFVWQGDHLECRRVYPVADDPKRRRLLSKMTAQRRCHLFDRVPACGNGRSEVEEAVDLAGILGQSRLDSGGGQPGGVCPTLVTERVELSSDDQGRGEAGEILADRREPLVLGQRAASCVCLDEPVVDLARKHQPIVSGARGVALVHPVCDVDRGVDQDLERHFETLLLGPQRSHRSKAAACAVATDGHPLGIDAEVGCVGDHPRKGGPCVVGGGRERVLGGESVVDGDHDDTGAIGDSTILAIVGLEVAEHEPPPW